MMSMTITTEIPWVDLSTGPTALSNNTTLRRFDADFISYPCGLQRWQIPTYKTSTMITFIVLNWSMGFLIIACNLLTISAILREPRLRVLSNMYISSLAITDLMTGCLLIISGTAFLPDCRFWLYGRKNYCLVVLFLLHVSNICSAVHMVLISLDRYVFLMKPLQYTIISGPMLRWGLVTAWGTSILYGLLVYVAAGPGPVKSCVAYNVLNKAYSVYGITITHFTFAVITAYVYGSIAWLSIKLQTMRPEHYKEADSGQERASIPYRFSQRLFFLGGTNQGLRRWTRVKFITSNIITWLLFGPGRKLQRVDTGPRTVSNLPRSEARVVQQSPTGGGYLHDRSFGTSTSDAAGAVHVDVHRTPLARAHLCRLSEPDETVFNAFRSSELVAASAGESSADVIDAVSASTMSYFFALSLPSTITTVDSTMGLAPGTPLGSSLSKSDTAGWFSLADAFLSVAHRTERFATNTQQARDNRLQATVNYLQTSNNCNNERITENDKQARRNDRKAMDMNQQAMTTTQSATDSIQQPMGNEVPDFSANSTPLSDPNAVGSSWPSSENSMKQTSFGKSAGARDWHTEDRHETAENFNSSSIDTVSSVPETSIPTTLVNAQASKMNKYLSFLAPKSGWKGAPLSLRSRTLNVHSSATASLNFIMSNFHRKCSHYNPIRYWKSVRLFVYVFVSFVLFWTPYHVCLFVNLRFAVSKNVMLATSFLGFFHSSFNFFIYAMTSRDFRKYFKRTMCPCYRRPGRRSADQHTATVSGMSTPFNSLLTPIDSFGSPL